MKPVLVLGAGLVALAGMQASQGTMRPSPGTLGGQPSSYSSFRAYSPPQTNYSAPAPYGSGVIGAQRFQPYSGQSVYSNRGGVNGYPSAPKPKGYVSPYGAGGTSVYAPYGR